MDAKLAAVAILLLVAGCATPGPSPAAQATAPDELLLEGCDVHQGILDISRDDARSVVPDTYEVAPYPALTGAPGSPDSARMDAPFVRCERVTIDGVDHGAFTFFGAGIAIVSPEGGAPENLTVYYGLGAIVSPPAAASVIRAWNVTPTDDGLVEATPGASGPAREMALVARAASGEARLADRLIDVEPLARPREINRIYGPNGTAYDYRIEPHDAVVGDATFTVEAQGGWLAQVPAPRGAQISAHAASPEWNVRIVRYAEP